MKRRTEIPLGKKGTGKTMTQREGKRDCYKEQDYRSPRVREKKSKQTNDLGVYDKGRVTIASLESPARQRIRNGDLEGGKRGLKCTSPDICKMEA